MLSPSEVANIRSLKKTAVVYLVMLRLDRPTGPTEIADILDIHIGTVHSYLRSLTKLGIITRTGYMNGYILTVIGRQMALGHPVEIPQVPSPSSLDPPNNSFPTTDLDPAILTAFYQAGIGINHRTRVLAQQAHITPEYILAHNLQLISQDKENSPGLLITILESGQPAPPLNRNGHLEGCTCEACDRLKYSRCFYCGPDPCTCPSD